MKVFGIPEPINHFLIFAAAGILWFIGFVVGSILLDGMTLFNNPESAIIAWGIIWGVCLAVGAIVTSTYVYDH